MNGWNCVWNPKTCTLAKRCRRDLGSQERETKVHDDKVALSVCNKLIIMSVISAAKDGIRLVSRISDMATVWRGCWEVLPDARSGVLTKMAVW